VPERLIGAVLKTDGCKSHGGSNPSLPPRKSCLKTEYRIDGEEAHLPVLGMRYNKLKCSCSVIILMVKTIILK
jgi:hypothetical protein